MKRKMNIFALVLAAVIMTAMVLNAAVGYAGEKESAAPSVKEVTEAVLGNEGTKFKILLDAPAEMIDETFLCQVTGDTETQINVVYRPEDPDNGKEEYQAEIAGSSDDYSSKGRHIGRVEANHIDFDVYIIDMEYTGEPVPDADPGDHIAEDQMLLLAVAHVNGVTFDMRKIKFGENAGFTKAEIQQELSKISVAADDAALTARELASNDAVIADGNASVTVKGGIPEGTEASVGDYYITYEASEGEAWISVQDCSLEDALEVYEYEKPVRKWETTYRGKTVYIYITAIPEEDGQTFDISGYVEAGGGILEAGRREYGKEANEKTSFTEKDVTDLFEKVTW